MKNNFILCADARTGSHMLQTALDTHPEISCYGEILNPGSNDTLLDVYSPKEAVNIVFTHCENPSGFIIHRHRKDLSDIWKNLISNKSIKVIFMGRRDSLRRYGSLKKARLTQKWINKTGEQPDNRKVKFDEREFYREFVEYIDRLMKSLELFGEHQFMLVDYEDLTGNWEGTLLEIQHFLEVEPQSLKPQTFKQGKTALDELFENPEAITTDLLKFGG